MPSQEPQNELNWRLLLMGTIVCAVTAAAIPYVTLKLGMGVDLTYGGMFMAAALLGRHASGQRLAIQLNIIQTMINVVSGIGFMVVILAAFYYIQNVFGRDIGFHPEWWQVAVWLFVSANLGIFMGVLPRRAILDDASLPWPTGRAVLSVAQTLSDPAAGAVTQKRRNVLTVTTAVAGFLTFLKDGLGIIGHTAGKAALSLSLGMELAGFGLGMLIPLSVGLSGLLGAWIISVFGESTAKLSALSGTAPANWDACTAALSKGEVTDFLTHQCGHAAEYITSPSHFKLLIQWMMWPATAMMIAAALTSVLVPLVRNLVAKKRAPAAASGVTATLADEHVPGWWLAAGIITCVLALLWLQEAWFDMPWQEVLLAVALQPILIVAGLRVLGITGTGPVSLMANATQFIFGLIWPSRIQQNLNAAHISADPQASSESVMGSFWVARRVGGRFRTLIVAQLIMIPIGALLIPLVFNVLEHAYGVGTDPGQLSAPTGLKIASLAMVMEKGVATLPKGALLASIIGAGLGVVMELLLMVRKRAADGTTFHDSAGNTRSRYWWVPVPSALGFALILPPTLTIAMAIGSVAAAAWHKFSQSEKGSYEMFAAPLAAGLIAGEAIVGAILVPLLGALVELLGPYLP